jgi:anaerobic ribonucleoside-triphosphate reductase activating protein
VNAPLQINVATYVEATEAEGPGKRFALWVQGCPMRCAGCCNPEMLEFEDRAWTDVAEVGALVLAAADKHGLEGVSFLGGEPFSQAEALAALSALVRPHGLTVMVYTGFTLESLRKRNDHGVDALLAQADLLVDGPFVASRPDRTRRWIGSLNQRGIALTEAYAELASAWDTSPDTVEVRITSDGRLLVNGSPYLLSKLGRM